VVDDAGALQLAAHHSKAGQYLDLRFEMDTIVVLHVGPHPLATATKYAPPAIKLQARRGPAPAADDPCRVRCPENARGYINTERMFPS
jgi:uncharacterized protein YcgI (DUF1989 family)